VIEEVVTAVSAVGAAVAVHCCAADVPFDVLTQTATHAVSLDAGLLPQSAYDDAAAWVDGGRDLWLGVVPTSEPATPPTDADITRTVLDLWSRLGHTEPETLPDTVLTPTCGLAGAARDWARTALQLCATTAANLSAEHGRMDV
jgi:methionine synthase II (cobalamin-independent)